MVTNQHSRWATHGAAFALWALAAASCVYWGLKFSAAPAMPPATPPVVAAVNTDPAAVGRLLGANPVAAGPAATPLAPPVASRFALVGVVASASGGAALIAVDGRPPRPYRVGSRVDEGLVLQSVQPRRAVLAAAVDGPPLATLEVPVRGSAAQPGPAANAAPR